MNTKILIAFALISTAICSCKPIKTTSTTSKTMKINNTGVFQIPVVVDLDVKQVRVNGSFTTTLTLPIETLKNKAVEDAITNSSAEVLIEPSYKLEKIGSKTTMSVTGYPGFYKNFRTVKDAEELKLIQASPNGNVKIATIAPTNQK